MLEISEKNRLIAYVAASKYLEEQDLDVMARLIAEFMESHDELERKGYRYTGSGLLAMIREEVPDAGP